MQKLLCSTQLEIERLNKENKVLTKCLKTQQKTLNKKLSIYDQNHLNSIQHSSLTPQTHDVDDWGYSSFRMRSQQQDQWNCLYSCNWYPCFWSCLQSHTRILHQQDHSFILSITYLHIALTRPLMLLLTS